MQPAVTGLAGLLLLLYLIYGFSWMEPNFPIGIGFLVAIPALGLAAACWRGEGKRRLRRKPPG